MPHKSLLFNEKNALNVNQNKYSKKVADSHGYFDLAHPLITSDSLTYSAGRISSSSYRLHVHEAHILWRKRQCGHTTIADTQTPTVSTLLPIRFALPLALC